MYCDTVIRSGQVRCHSVHFLLFGSKQDDKEKERRKEEEKERKMKEGKEGRQEERRKEMKATKRERSTLPV